MSKYTFGNKLMEHVFIKFLYITRKGCIIDIDFAAQFNVKRVKQKKNFLININIYGVTYRFACV